MVACDGTWSTGVGWFWGEKSAIQKWNEEHPSPPIELSSEAQKLGAKLENPTKQRMATNDSIQIKGSMNSTASYLPTHLWIYVEFEGKTNGLPSEFNYYPQVKKGVFEQKIQLFAGKGLYKVSIRIPSKDKEDYYDPFTTFEVMNLKETVQREISYTTEGKDQRLILEQPTTGFLQAKQAVTIQGEVSLPKGQQMLLVQVIKGTELWKKLIPVFDNHFREEIPLLYGSGLHEIQVMVPDLKRADYYLQGATFFVENQSNQKQTPIQYSQVYEERGLHLLEPVAGGLTYQGKILVRGELDPQNSQAKQTKYIVVQTRKGKDEATYFLPVRNDQFSQWVPLRFGSGKYEISLAVPEVPEQRRSFFRFYTALEFTVSSSMTKDVRNLIPSRGIESDHVKIQSLAKELTSGQSTTYNKAKAIYQYVAKNTLYDVNKLQTNDFAWDDSALKTLRRGKGVCQDYTYLTIALLRASDIPARFVEGSAGGQRHAWIEAYIEGKWITMDPTWGSGYLTPNEQFVKKYDPSYFNPDKNMFAKTHHRTGVVY